MARPPPEPSDPRAAALERLKRAYIDPTPEALAAHIAGYRSDLVEAFLAAGVTPDAREAAPPRRTALMLALVRGEVKEAARLLDAGADVALADDHGLTAMGWAAICDGLWSWSPGLASVCERMAASPGASAEDREIAAAMGNPYGAFARLLRRWCALRRPDRVDRMRPGASPAQLGALAARAGRELPAAFTALYSTFDGEGPAGRISWRLLPLDEIAATGDRMRKLAVHTDKGRTLRWPDAWLPFAIDVTGDLLFLAPKLLGDKRPSGMKAPTEPVYHYLHDEERITRDAWSFSQSLPRVFERLPRPGYPMG